MVKPIVYKPLAARALRKMPANTARRIIEKIESYVADPTSQLNNVKALKNSNAIRLRVGDWRVIMLDDEVLDVIDVGPRGSIYE